MYSETRLNLTLSISESPLHMACGPKSTCSYTCINIPFKQETPLNGIFFLVSKRSSLDELHCTVNAYYDLCILNYLLYFLSIFSERMLMALWYFVRAIIN